MRTSLARMFRNMADRLNPVPFGPVVEQVKTPVSLHLRDKNGNIVCKVIHSFERATPFVKVPVFDIDPTSTRDPLDILSHTREFYIDSIHYIEIE